MKKMVIEAPGRINLLGEHLDYNQGIVLPAAINRFIEFKFTENANDAILIEALDLNETLVFELAQLNQLQTMLPQLTAVTEVSRSGGSVAQIISNSARSSGIRVSRMQPQNEQLTLVLEDVSFETLLTWLHALQYQHGIKLVSLDLATADKAGMVRVRRMVVE